MRKSKKYTKKATHSLGKAKMISKSKEEIKEEKAREKQLKRNYISDLMPIVRWDNDKSTPIMRDGTILGMLGIRQKNLSGATQDEVMLDNLYWDKLYKTYSDDLKLVYSVFPTDTKKQIRYIDKLIKKTENPAYIDFLQIKKAELEWILLNKMEKTAILFFYAKNNEDYINKYYQIKGTMQNLVYDLEADRKIKMLQILFNKDMAL